MGNGPDSSSVNREPTHTSELQALVLPGSGVSKVSSRPFKDVDGSTKHVDVLHVLGAKAIIIVGKVGENAWRAEPLYNDLRKPTSGNLEAFTRRARQLGVNDPTRPTLTDGFIGQQLKSLAESARLSAPGVSPSRSVRRPLQAR
jgi:hypothetical protein